MDLKELLYSAPTNIKKDFVYRKHKKGKQIILPNEENDSLYILIEGIAEVHRQNYAGNMISFYIYDAYSCFGEIEIFHKNSKTWGVTAKTDCETIRVNRRVVFDWMKADFDFTCYIVEQLSEKLISSSNKTVRLSLLNIKDRILSSVYAHYKIGDLEHITKELLSVEVCAPIRSLNRSIAQCKEEGFIDYSNKKFTVLSIEKLDRYMEELL